MSKCVSNLHSEHSQSVLGAEQRAKEVNMELVVRVKERLNLGSLDTAGRQAICTNESDGLI